MVSGGIFFFFLVCFLEVATKQFPGEKYCFFMILSCTHMLQSSAELMVWALPGSKDRLGWILPCHSQVLCPWDMGCPGVLAAECPLHCIKPKGFCSTRMESKHLPSPAPENK